MYFLGQAANFSIRQTFAHFFASGSSRHSQKLQAYLAKRYQSTPEQVFLYDNGRSALAAALRATLSPTTNTRPKVIINGFTCYAVFEAVKSAGCQPIFADIDRQTLHFNAQTLQATLTRHPDTAAVIIQNTFGIPADLAAIERLVKKHRLILIEDLAHCVGTSYADGREAGTVGAATALSFGKGKSVDTITGGALILRQAISELPSRPTKRPILASSLRARWYPFFGLLTRVFYRLKLGKLFTILLLKLHFIQRSADAKLSLRTRLTHWQAKLALIKLQKLSANRSQLRDFYLVDNRHFILKQLERQGYIMQDFWYEVPVSPLRYYQKINFPVNDCPTAVEVASKIINLPTHYPKSVLRPAHQFIAKYQRQVAKEEYGTGSVA